MFTLTNRRVRVDLIVLSPVFIPASCNLFHCLLDDPDPPHKTVCLSVCEDEEGGLMNIHWSSQEDRVLFILLKPRVWDYSHRHLGFLGALSDRVCKEGGAVEEPEPEDALRQRCGGRELKHIRLYRLT